MIKFEDFIIELLKNNKITNYTAKREEVREIYYKEFKSKARDSFSHFFRELWRYWYISDFTKEHVYFSQRWINYISQLERAQNALKEQEFEKKNIFDKNGCQLCLIKFSNEKMFTMHRECIKHKVRVQYLRDKTTFKQSDDIYLKILEINNTANNETTSLKMKFEQKTNINATLHLINNCKDDASVVDIMQINQHVTDLTMTAKYEKGTTLKPNENIVIILNGYFENSASFDFPVVIVTKHANKKDLEYFLKEIPIEVTSEFSELKPETDYVRPKKPKHRETLALVIPGKRPLEHPTLYKEDFPLKLYEISPPFQTKLMMLITEYPNFIERNYVRNNFLHRRFSDILEINPVLSENNYCDLFQTLVSIEENQIKVDIREFDTVSSLHFKGGTNYELEVPGLAEARPSLLVHDSVYVKEYKNDTRKYQGIVHKVLETSVILGFNTSFANIFVNNKKFHIEFGYNRRSVRVEKQALYLAKEHNIVPYFYPKREPKSNKQKVINSVKYFNPVLNEEQKRAVKNILEEKSVPYLIFGPPGTGKTVTIVEIILQIWKNQPQSRILVCAPSNAATNEIALRLVNNIPSVDIFRLVGNMYGQDKQLEKLKSIINVKADGLFYMPSMEELLKFRVVLTTLVTAARIVNGGVPDGHYSHVFIDESGYATESQSLIPMAGILSNGRNRGKVVGQIVLAGDPKQLGPVVHSQFAKDCGYGTSMLERLINTCKIYARNENKPIAYNERCVTKLIRNYRSHKSILKIPNELFYHNELIAAGSELSNLFTNWEHLRSPGFPVIFHNVVGEDKREKNSPSFYNIQEIEEVVGYISKLIGIRVKGFEIQQDHIGIITPYRKQAEMLRKACEKKRWNQIVVGSVEQFQGKEKLIVIISTVRSKNTNRFEEVDKKCQLGFVGNPKRFNVAITRAKGLLIVVGNALVLENDKNWFSFIQYCVENKSIAGRAFSLSHNKYQDDEIAAGSGET